MSTALALMLMGAKPMPIPSSATACRVIDGKRQPAPTRKESVIGLQRRELNARILAMVHEHVVVTKHDMAERLNVPLPQIESALDVMSYLGTLKWTRISGRAVVWEIPDASSEQGGA